MVERAAQREGKESQQREMLMFLRPSRQRTRDDRVEPKRLDPRAS